jgi:hypothetical protein
MLLALALLAFQLTPSQDATLAAGLKDLAAIDAEVVAITEHQDVLRKSRAARLDEVASLEARYREIVLTDAMSIEQIYKALYAVRRGRAARLKPLALEKGRAAHVEFCRARAKVQETRARIEASDEYKKLSLADRLAWRGSVDGLMGTEDCSDVR